MKKTPFAGISQLEPGDNPSETADFFEQDRATIDHFLEVGAVTHHHDAHAALANPAAAPSGSVIPDGGAIPADLGIYLGYTLLDADGGETTISPLLTLATPPAYDAPETPLRATVTYNSGAVLADTYYYAITLVDGMGGETVLGPVLSVDRAPGPQFASITIDGLDDDFGVASAVGWRLYKSRAGQDFGFFASGSGDRFVDQGQGCVDCGQPPPSVNRTNRTNTLQMYVPGSAGAGSAMGGVGSGTARFRLYASLDGSFDGAALMGDFPSSSAGTVMNFPAISLLDGHPPDVPTTSRGASRINADTDLTNYFWRTPVANSGALPAGARGDVRVAMDSGVMYEAVGASGASAGGHGWRAGLRTTDADQVPIIDTSLLEFRASGAALDVSVSASGAGKAVVTITNTADPGVGTRRIASAVTASLASGASAAGGLDIGPGWRILEVRASKSSRLEVYASSADATADAARAIGTDPTGDHGVMLDFVMPALGSGTSDLTWRLSPVVDGASMEVVPSRAIPIRVTNMEGTGAVTVAVVYVRTE